jgi:hypothetical protein
MSLWDIHTLLREATSVPVSVFVDMDGVLADFQVEFLRKFGGSSNKDIDRILAAKGWSGVGQEYPELFARLPEMPDASRLMSALLRLQTEGRIKIHILTALPNELINTRSREDKAAWIRKRYKYLADENIHIVTRSQKQNFATVSNLQDVAPVLIDDFKKNIDEWRSAGGFGILHTSAASSLNMLQTYLRRHEVR